MDKYGTPDQGFTVVCTTYRLTEHYHYWTKNNPMNVQLVPEPFVEIPVELAADLAIKGGDKVKVTSARGALHCQSHGHPSHQAHEHRRQESLSDRHSDPLRVSRHSERMTGKMRAPLTNSLSPTVTDPNAYTPEFKGFLVKLEKA